MLRRKCLLLVLTALLASRADWASADTVTFNLNTEFSGAQEPSGTAPWLRAAFEDVVGGVRLTLTSLLQDPDEFVTEWDFNFTPDTSVTGLVFSYVSGVVAESISKGTDAFKADGDGNFDIQFIFPQSGNRFTQGSTSVYDITGTGITAQSFNLGSEGGPKGSFFSAAHVQGIGPTAGESGWIGAPISTTTPGEPGGGGSSIVPEPSSLALLCMGGLAMMGYGIRRRKPQAA